jgi:hypothetical protein
VLGDLPVVAPGVAIFDHLRGNIDPAGRLPAEVTLPDDERVASGSPRWVPGALDGVVSHHSAVGGVDRAAEVAALLSKACRRPAVRHLRALYEGVAADDVMEYVDALIETLHREPPNRQALHAIGRWLATTASDRGAVKLGVALLGVTGLGDEVAVVRTLGAHEEFTVYCAVAVSNGLPDPESELWALASAVDGWGRVQCVERLRGTSDPDIRAWLLREGFRNSIMYEYLAYIAATTGGLLAALHGDVDRGLLTSAGEILSALIEGGPAEDIDDYESAADAVEAFLSLMDKRAETLGDFSTVAKIQRYLSQEREWTGSWTTSRREAFEVVCARVLGQDRWLAEIDAGLASPNQAEFYLATEAARVRGVDTFEAHVSRIEADPYGMAWYEAWRQAGASRAERLADLARTLLPIADIATGPADESGLGPGWRAHSALDWTLQSLREHPGVGTDLVLAGLRSPVTRNRNLALSALQQWPRDIWPPEAPAAIETVAAADPNPRTRELAAKIVTPAPE